MSKIVPRLQNAAEKYVATNFYTDICSGSRKIPNEKDWLPIISDPIGDFLVWTEEQNNAIMVEEKVANFDVEFWKERLTAGCSKDEAMFWEAIVSTSKECYSFLDKSNTSLVRTQKCLASIFIGTNYPLVRKDKQYLPIYTLWMHTMVENWGWSIEEKGDLWKHLQKGFWLFVKINQNENVDEMASFLSIFFCEKFLIEIDMLYSQVYALKKQAKQKKSREFKASTRFDPFKKQISPISTYIRSMLPSGISKL